jgi:hypothetical protein
LKEEEEEDRRYVTGNYLPIKIYVNCTGVYSSNFVN